MRYRIIDEKVLSVFMKKSKKTKSKWKKLGLNINICEHISIPTFQLCCEDINEPFKIINDMVDEYNLSDINISTLNKCSKILIYYLKGNKIRMLPICTSQQFKQIEREEKLNRILYV